MDSGVLRGSLLLGQTAPECRSFGLKRPKARFSALERNCATDVKTAPQGVVGMRSWPVLKLDANDDGAVAFNAGRE